MNSSTPDSANDPSECAPPNHSASGATASAKSVAAAAENVPIGNAAQLILEFRVQYHQTDGQGRVHHGQYVNYFERGRVELLRSLGQNYRDFEQELGLFLVVSEMNIRYIGAAVFDDLLRLTTQVEDVRGVRIRHSYRVERLDEQDQSKAPELIAEGYTVVACVDRTGKVRRLPKVIRDL